MGKASGNIWIKSPGLGKYAGKVGNEAKTEYRKVFDAMNLEWINVICMSTCQRNQGDHMLMQIFDFWT